jgi:inositol phosphorylceramide synthase catalytic subunit
MKFKEVMDRVRHPNNRWRVYVLAGIVVYFITINQLIHVRPDHAFLALIVFALVVLGKHRAKQFIFDWLPFIAFWIAYDMMRGIADSIRGLINVVPPYNLELLLFGWITGGQIPAFFFEHFQAVHEGHPIKIFFDILGANCYTLHFAAPLILGWIFWHTTNDRPMFYKFVWTITLLNAMALATFMIYPAAPPWYVYRFGLAQPFGDIQGSAGALVNFDKLIGKNFLQSIWDTFNSNLYAAIPSLHGAYPCVIAFFGMKKFRKKRWLWPIYPIATWFSAVYLDEHYVIDLFIGLGYAAAAYFFVKGFLYPKVFGRYVAKTNISLK